MPVASYARSRPLQARWSRPLKRGLRRQTGIGSRSAADHGGLEPAGEAHENGGRPTGGECAASATGKRTRLRPRCAIPEVARRFLQYLPTGWPWLIAALLGIGLST